MTWKAFEFYNVLLTRLPEVSFHTLPFVQIICRLLLTSCPFNAAQSKIRVQNPSNGTCLVISITPLCLPPPPTSFGRQAGDPPAPSGFFGQTWQLMFKHCFLPITSVTPPTPDRQTRRVLYLLYP